MLKLNSSFVALVKCNIAKIFYCKSSRYLKWPQKINLLEFYSNVAIFIGAFMSIGKKTLMKVSAPNAIEKLK